MHKPILEYVVAAALAAIAFAGVAGAQQVFDGTKFFEELASRGVDTKVDGNKFFEEIAKRGFNSKNPIDGAKFFEELANHGVDTKGIDGNKFFEELAHRGVKMPEVVIIKRCIAGICEGPSPQ